jgi:hypothetical protein
MSGYIGRVQNTTFRMFLADFLQFKDYYSICFPVLRLVSGAWVGVVVKALRY